MIALALVATALGPATYPAAAPGASEVLVNGVAIDARGRLFWNGRRLRDVAELDRYLAIVPQLDPQPRTALAADARAPRRIVARVRAAMERRLHCARTTACDLHAPHRDRAAYSTQSSPMSR